MKCKIVNKTADSIELCAYSEPVCPSNYRDDAVEKFKMFLNDISSPEKIQENLDIVSNAPTSKDVEIDDRAPDTLKIKVRFVEDTALDYFFEITNSNNQLIECRYNSKSFLSTKFTDEYLLLETIQLSPKKPKTLSYLPVVNSKYLNVFLNCYYLPQNPYHYFKTQTFLAYSHYTGKVTAEDYAESPNPNCAKHNSDPYCASLRIKNCSRASLRF